MNLINLLKENDIFSRFSDEAMEQVISVLEERQYKAGDIIFNYGDDGGELIIVKSGQIAIFMPTDTDDLSLGEAIRLFDPGQALGEMALIDKKPRSASARAEQDSVILALCEPDFNRLLTAYPEMNGSIMVGLSDRIRYTTDFLNEVRQWVQSIGDGDYQPDFLSEMSGWMKDIGDGDYDEVAEKAARYENEMLAQLAGEFAQMAAKVKQREDDLKEEVAQLKVEIDEVKRKADVEEIVGSDYYQRIRQQAAEMRRLRDAED